MMAVYFLIFDITMPSISLRCSVSSSNFRSKGEIKVIFSKTYWKVDIKGEEWGK